MSSTGRKSTCSACGEEGHYKSTCPHRPAADKDAERDAKYAQIRRPASVIKVALEEAHGSTTRAGEILRVSHQRVRQYIVRLGLEAWVEEVRARFAPNPEELAEQRRKRAAESAALRARDNRAKGKCRCGRRPKVVDEDGVRRKLSSCAKCIKRSTRGNSTMRDRRIAEGKCPRCGGDPDGENLHCRRCLDYASTLQKKSR